MARDEIVHCDKYHERGCNMSTASVKPTCYSSCLLSRKMRSTSMVTINLIHLSAQNISQFYKFQDTVLLRLIGIKLNKEGVDRVYQEEHLPENDKLH